MTQSNFTLHCRFRHESFCFNDFFFYENNKINAGGIFFTNMVIYLSGSGSGSSFSAAFMIRAQRMKILRMPKGIKGLLEGISDICRSSLAPNMVVVVIIMVVVVVVVVIMVVVILEVIIVGHSRLITLIFGI